MSSQPGQTRLSAQLVLEDQADPQDQVVRQDSTIQLILQDRVDLQGQVVQQGPAVRPDQAPRVRL